MINRYYISLVRMAELGKQRLADFYVDPSYINVNHGSYGYVPRVVMEEKRKLMERCEFNTEKWFRWDVEGLVEEARTYIAYRINCSPQNVFLVQNATDGINSILKSFNWKEDDTVLIPNTAYACVRKTVVSLKDRYNINILDLNFTVDDFKSPESIQLKVENFVNAYPKKIRFAILDHIISVPAIVMPVDTLQQFFQEKGIPLFIDGAHAINQLNPAAYFSNFHKWGFAPKNAAFLYISDKFLNTIKPALTGNMYGQGPAREFFWTGTRDYTSYLVVRKALEYSDSFGESRVMSYNHSLALVASKRVAEIWKTREFTLDARCVGSMFNVEVPCSDLALASGIAYEMLVQDNCYPIFYLFEGKIWTRVSVQLYNQLSDYEFMAKTFLARLNKHLKEGTRPVAKPQRQ